MFKPSVKVAVYTLIALIVASAVWWPIQELRPLTLGIDAFEYHAPLFGQHTQSQTISATQPISEIGALIVPLQSSDAVPDTLVTISNATTQEVIQSQTIPGHSLRDDAFTTITLPQPLSSRDPLLVTLSAPSASAKTALGIRFHPEDAYPNGERFFDGKPVPGDLALSLEQRLPLWRVALHRASDHRQKTNIIVQAIGVAILAGLMASRIGWADRSPTQQKWIERCIIIALALLVLGSRFPALTALHGVSGGDPYNYLLITDSFSKLENPFAADKRLPGYPLLLLPAYLTAIDDHLWMRLINILSAAGCVVLLHQLTRRLGLPWPVQLIAPLLLAFQKDFYWISLRPEPYTLYAFLLLASLVLFFSAPSKRTHFLFGLTLGYAAMTRQEGFVAAAILGAAALVHHAYRFYQKQPRSDIKTATRELSYMFLPALFLVLPFFIHNTLTFGNPIYTPYFEGERLNIVNSWPAFQDALGGMWGVLGSLWKTSWDQLERIALNSSTFLVGALGSLLWWFYHRFRLPQQKTVEAALLILLSFSLLVWAGYSFTRPNTVSINTFTALSAGALMVGPIAFITAGRWPGALVTVLALSQILIATWFHPFPKHYQQDLALIVLALATLVIAAPTITLPRWPRLATLSTYVALIFAFALAVVPLYQPGQFNKLVDQENANNALDSVVYRAINVARELPAPHGIEQAYLPARLYLQSNSVAYNEFENSSPKKEEAWLEQKEIKTLIFTNLEPIFQNLGPEWHEVARFKAAGKDEKVLEGFVYTRK